MGIDMRGYAGSSEYLKAADLKGREVSVTIVDVGTQEYDNEGVTEVKPWVKFRDKEKGVVLNVTNTRRLCDEFGDDSDSWIGKEIVLYPERVDFKGNMVDAIRVRVPKPLASDDDIPF